jgi:multidrug resistance efflux pump
MGRHYRAGVRGGSLRFSRSTVPRSVCRFEGTIATLAVAEGDAVNAGNPIARLADREACVELRKVEAELTQQRARLPALKISHAAAVGNGSRCTR